MEKVREKEIVNYKKADTRLYREEVLPYVNDLARLACYITGNSHDGDDLLQETLLSAYRSFHTYRPETNCRAWLMTIMRNQFVDQARRNKRQGYPVVMQPDQVNRLSPQYESPRQISDPEKTVSGRLIMESLRKLIGKLPAAFRRVFVLRFLKHFSYREIARIMECPMGTVRSRIFRARNMFKSMVKQDRAIPLLDYH